MKKKSLIQIILFLVIISTASFIIICLDSIKRNESTVQFKKVDSNSFTIIVLPDTQNYSANNPDILCEQTKWIVDHKDDLNIVFVSQMGDIVNDGAEKMQEWKAASKCFGTLDGVVPYGVIPGNHDIDTPHNKSSGFSVYNEYFPVSRFKKYSWYGGNYENNQNNFERVAVNGINLLFLNLEIEPSDEVLVWAGEVAKSYPESYTIVTTHKYLPVTGNVRDDARGFSKDGNTGEQIWQKLIKDNCSIAMVWSGHFHGENWITSKNTCGQVVEQVVQDYQDRNNGGDGWLRIYTFFPNNKTIQVRTFSPHLSKFEEDVDSSFSLPFNVR